jgi:hypothetical protein
VEGNSAFANCLPRMCFLRLIRIGTLPALRGRLTSLHLLVRSTNFNIGIHVTVFLIGRCIFLIVVIVESGFLTMLRGQGGKLSRGRSFSAGVNWVLPVLSFQFFPLSLRVVQLIFTHHIQEIGIQASEPGGIFTTKSHLIDPTRQLECMYILFRRVS